MNDGIVLQSQLRPMPNDDSAAIPTHSALSISSLATKKQNYLYKYVLFGLVFLFLLVIIILVAIIVSKISSYSAMPIPIASTMTRTNEPLIKKELSSLVDSITLEDMLIHLRQFESRAIGTVSFNRTIDYLTSQLNKENYFNVQKYYFSVPRVKLDANPILMSLPNISNASLFTFPKDFVPMDRSTEARNWSLTDGRPLSVVARLGCYIEDWNTTKEGDVALVQRGNCTFVHKILLATQKRVSAFLVYNDGLTLERLEPLNNTRAPKNNTLPTLFLSYEAGMRLILENISRIYMRVEFQSLPPAIVTNVCADTKQGNANRTIVVGSHSDSVSAANNQTTPPRAIPGSNRITRLFVDYFEQNRLPWDYTDFSGRSDYGPFLAEGIACGGLFAGADDIKNQEQRDRYLKMLGSTLGGMANTDLDPCYHRKCDTLENLNTFAYLHMTKAAAYVLDFLAQLQDLNHWLYP
ncbi:unnamed protein product [Rotaria magnacalcarata]|uniref:Peptide hydrolase n=1 Tax=Rotaria magnacalcarata TaxID=392030 RepID=A0A8S2KI09_9BILA|nr:unnamed protein product [Rotaria magnacalcarata]